MTVDEEDWWAKFSAAGETKDFAEAVNGRLLHFCDANAAPPHLDEEQRKALALSDAKVHSSDLLQ